MGDKFISDRVVTPIFRVSFPKVFEPDESEDGQKFWGVSMIFDPSAFDESDKKQFAAMQKIAKQAAFAKFGENLPPKFKYPFRKGTADEFDLEKRPEYKGMIITGAKSYNQKPGVLDMNHQPMINPSDFYAGCYAVASVTAFTYQKKGNVGVSFTLQNLKKMRDGEPLIAKSTPEQDFEHLAPSQEMVDNSDLFGDIDL